MSLGAAAVRDGNTIYSRLRPVGERESVGGMLARNAARLPGHAMYGVRRDGTFHRVSWKQCLDDVVTLGRFLSEAGVGENTRVVSVSPNRGELLVVELATMCLGATYVPIFAGYSSEQLRDLIEYADPTVLVVAGRQQLMRACVPQTVRALITLDPLTGADRDAAPAGSLTRVLAFADALERGAGGASAAAAGAFLAAAAQVDPSTACLMMYTSGTSGRM
ncbi:MAG: AMP-binding protein, partial [Gemmatimonadaceae bacterium]|nr:AMP-binding protein [Gemmatimonadaceae bacterium]